MSKHEKKGLVPELRFPEFQDKGEWKVKKLVNLVSTIKPPKKLLTEDYLEVGDYPVIDQSKDYICGWTNDHDALVTDPLPLIIFGDHTCTLKLATKPFAQGADGIKILESNDLIEPQYLYQFLQADPVVMESYKRHFSILKEKKVLFPNKDRGEQQKIADCFSSLDQLIAAHTKKHEALQRYKKGLLQNLFPAEGKSVPKLRFPEFRDKGEWVIKDLIEFFPNIRNGFVGTASPYYEENGVPYLQGKNIKLGYINETGLIRISQAFHSKQKKSQLRENDILMVQSGHVGECAVVCKEFDDANCHALIILSPTGQTCSSFFKYLFYAPSGRALITKVKTGNTIAHILASDLCAMQVLVPKLEEQQKIADCLSSIDKLITSQSQKIEALKDHKKALMQRLFPSMDEVEI